MVADCDLSPKSRNALSICFLSASMRRITSKPRLVILALPASASSDGLRRRRRSEYRLLPMTKAVRLPCVIGLALSTGLLFDAGTGAALAFSSLKRLAKI